MLYTLSKGWSIDRSYLNFTNYQMSDFDNKLEACLAQDNSYIYNKLGIRMCIFASRRPVRRLCVRVLCTGEACVARVTLAVQEAVWCWQYSSRVVIPDLHLHHQRTPSSAHVSKQSISECVTYTQYLWYVTTFRVTFLSVTHHICMDVLCENRSSIQSPALMCSAILTKILLQVHILSNHSDCKFSIPFEVRHRHCFTPTVCVHMK